MFDWNHLKSNNISYRRHLKFAICVALRLIPTVVLLLFHAVLPFVKMPKALSIAGASNYLFDRECEIHERMIEALDIAEGRDVRDPE
tara:strand:+ start:241 stop:501 length:261 start_codon:yes stop_codon:yes gene_type:complete